MLVSALLFVVGLVLLIKGADMLVDGASNIATDYGVSQWIIGVTIIAFGTSVPELTISSISSWRGLGDMAMGNIVGSNIANIGLVVGLSAIIMAMKVNTMSIKKELLFMIVSSFLLMLFPLNLIGVTDLPQIGRIKGGAMLVIFAIFIFYVIKDAQQQRHKSHKDRKETPKEAKKSAKDLSLIVVGITGTVIGAKLVVDSGVLLAKAFGVSEAVIALTLIALGTSLPELVTSVVASFKGKADLSLGNIIGSNIFNILWVGGLSAMIRPIVLAPRLVIDAGVAVVFALALFMIVSTTQRVSKYSGIALFTGYIVYIGLTV